MFTCILILRYATDSFGSTKSSSVFPVNNFTRTSISPGRKLQAQNTPGASCPTGSFKKGRCRQNFTKAIGISTCVFRAQNQSISTSLPRGRLKITESAKFRKVSKWGQRLPIPIFHCRCVGSKLAFLPWLFWGVMPGKGSSLIQSIKYCCLTILRVCKF